MITNWVNIQGEFINLDACSSIKEYGVRGYEFHYGGNYLNFQSADDRDLLMAYKCIRLYLADRTINKARDEKTHHAVRSGSMGGSVSDPYHDRPTQPIYHADGLRAD